MRRIDELHMEHPFAGARMLRDMLKLEGIVVGRKHVSTLMKKLGIQPRRTVRLVLFTNEENGLRGGNAYRDAHAAEAQDHIFAIESDSGVFAPARLAFSGSESARRIIADIATLLTGIFMSMPLPGSIGQLSLRTGLFQLLPLALMALMVRPASLLAFALLIVAMAQLRIVLYGAPGTGSALYWLYTLTTIGFGLVLAGYRSDFAVSAWRMRRRLVQQASTDPVTGLLNRNGWSERAEAAHARAAAAGVPLALVVLDIDFFKRINDRLGHDGGDAVLQRLGAIMQARAGVRGCAARIGGEEFAVLLEGHDAGSARTFAEYVRGEFGGEHEGAVTTLSAGVAEHRPGETLRELMRRADLALYSAKREGRDRVCVAPVS